MPRTTYLLTALSLIGLYLWRTHRVAPLAAGLHQGSVQPGSGPGAPVGTPPLVNPARIGSGGVGGYDALRF